MVLTVILSDGQPAKVTRLGIFELDGVGPEVTGPFTYTFELANGQTVEEYYDISALTTPPSHPGVPEDQIVERSPQWWALLEWQTYKAAVVHEIKRIESATGYVKAVSAFIAGRCLSPEDRARVVTDEDWEMVYDAALVPQLTVEILAGTFRDTFSASFDGMEIFDALKRMIGGHGAYDAIRVWEITAINQAGYTEEEWADLSLSERARRVGALMLPRMMEALEMDKSTKEMQQQNAATKPV